MNHCCGEAARARRKTYLGTEHLLLGLAGLPASGQPAGGET
jgi:hypothetical protein